MNNQKAEVAKEYFDKKKCWVDVLRGKNQIDRKKRGKNQELDQVIAEHLAAKREKGKDFDSY